jgi:type IV pilus assembly protein PilC
LGTFLNYQNRRFKQRRRAAYQSLFDSVRESQLSQKKAYSAWLFLGQLEKQHHENPRDLEDAYTYFSNRLADGGLSEWDSINPGSKQMTSREFAHLFSGIKRGDIAYKETLSAYRGLTPEPTARIRGFAPDGRIVAKYLEQLSLQFECGVPVIEALESLSQTSAHPYLAAVTDRVIDELSKRGVPLSVALSRYPECFPGAVVALIRAGEQSGSLFLGLRRGADMMDKQAQFRARIKAALSSPAIIMVLGSMLVFLIVKFIVPKFLEVYEQMDLEMPPLSNFVINLVSIMDSTWFLLLVLATSILLVYYREPIKQALFNLGLSTPVVGRWLRVGLAKEMCDILSDLHSCGVPLQRSFRILADCTPYDVHREQMLQASENIQQEGSLSDALGQVTTLPPIVVIMTHVGEESGALDSLLKSLARLLDDELDTSLNQLVTTIEPLAMAALGIGIAVLFVGLFLPIYGVIGNL